MKQSIEIGKRTFIIESGKIASGADGSCTVRYGDTIVLVTACSQTSTEPLSFFPLTCDYIEKRYAAGKIPGGFFKREGRPTAKEILGCRLIDRPIRPLFPNTYKDKVQIIATVLSADQENDGDIPAIIGASIAIGLSDIPLLKPIGAVRIGMINGDFIINPTFAELEESALELVVAGTKDGITTIEAGGSEVSEEDVFKAIKLANGEIIKLVEFQEGFIKTKKQVNKETSKQGFDLPGDIKKEIEKAMRITDRKQRQESLRNILDKIKEERQDKYEEQEMEEVFDDCEKEIIRGIIKKENKRLDGRGFEDIRDISCEVGVLPRAHGSGLFTRGETQSLCTVTLGTKMDEQKVEELTGESYKTFMLHYNFPPFSVGEVRFLRGPGRREIGHGLLAERALEEILPRSESFPYTIRIVSDILSSNGSSSMAAVCGSSLALMDAGIPIKAPVAGISIGLVDDVILTDIAGEEDHYGDMDFKIAGTRDGITAIQLDVKTGGINFNIIEKTLESAKKARTVILDKMEQAISSPRKDISSYAPKIKVIIIPKEKIGQVIGPGGKMIREITEKTGATIEIGDDGKVTISSSTWETTETAAKIIEGIVQDIEVGRTYIGKVTRIMSFGAIVEILPGKDGMIHISNLANHRVINVEDEVKVGDEVSVKVLNVDDQGKVQLSRKALMH